MYTLHVNELGACEICDHCFEKKHPWYYCSVRNDNFGDIDYPEECDEFVYIDDEGYDY